MKTIMLEKLKEVIRRLNEEERMIIHALFCEEITQVDLPLSTIGYQK